ncbi:hypothetical protein [Planctomicrobium sp. SH527]|uniref:hypothetical protein n=1 Tax=Planctomicrobium sp. SH527 TaxID=3448123 RepID=UPI003F5C7F8C
MICLAHELIADECGFLVSAELVILSTTLVLGLIVGLAAIRDAIGGELADLAQAFRGLDQSYYTTGVRGCQKPNGTWSAWTAGSSFFDSHLRTTGPVQESPVPEDLTIGCYKVIEPRLESQPCPETAPCVTPPAPAPVTTPACCPETLVPAPVPCNTCEEAQFAPIPEYHQVPMSYAPMGNAPSTHLPCLSCPPGPAGLLAPTPISVYPGRVSPRPVLIPQAEMYETNGMNGPAQFAPVIVPYRHNWTAPNAYGPLQVW